MATLHLFISKNRFSSQEDLDNYVQPTYTDDGDKIDSEFMNEVGLYNFEPGCIEATFETEASDLVSFLNGSSYYEQWYQEVPPNLICDTTLAIYEPNSLRHPEKCSLEYVGKFEYET